MIGVNLNLDLPTLDDTLTTIVSKTVTALSDIQDSIADLATPAALDINSSLTMNGNAITNLGSAVFVDGNANTAPGSIYFHNGEFYAVDDTGIVQLTAAGAVNVAGSGGIGGDYGTLGALESYDAATKRYLFQTDSSPRHWAGLAGGAVDVYEHDTTTTTGVRLQSPAGLGASYALTLPTGLPADDRPLSVDNTGQISTNANASVLLNVQSFTATGPWTMTNGTRYIRVRMVGGGGGGGGASAAGTQFTIGGGGSSGCYVETGFVSGVLAGGTVTIGAAGAAGASSGGDGGAGGDTTLVYNSGTRTYTAKGGLGGKGQTSPVDAATECALGGGQNPGSTNGIITFQSTGGMGLNMHSTTGKVGLSGAGGAVPTGAGGSSVAVTSTVQTSVAGVTPQGKGGGGSGAVGMPTGSAVAGGFGGAGLVIIEEYR